MSQSSNIYTLLGPHTLKKSILHEFHIILLSVRVTSRGHHKRNPIESASGAKDYIDANRKERFSPSECFRWYEITVTKLPSSTTTHYSIPVAMQKHFLQIHARAIANNGQCDFGINSTLEMRIYSAPDFYSVSSPQLNFALHGAFLGSDSQIKCHLIAGKLELVQDT